MEEKDQNEPKPGYLGKILEGHEEEYSPNAWSNIEKKLNEKAKKRAFFWWFTSLGILIVGLSSVLLWFNNKNDQQKESQIAKTQNSKIQKQRVKEYSISKPSRVLEKEKISSQKEKIVLKSDLKLDNTKDNRIQDLKTDAQNGEIVKIQKTDNQQVGKESLVQNKSHGEPVKQKGEQTTDSKNRNSNSESDKKTLALVPTTTQTEPINNLNENNQTEESSSKLQAKEASVIQKRRKVKSGKAVSINSGSTPIALSEIKKDKEEKDQPQRRSKIQNKRVKNALKTNLLASNKTKKLKSASVNLIDQKTISESKNKSEKELAQQEKLTDIQTITPDAIATKSNVERINELDKKSNENLVPDRVNPIVPKEETEKIETIAENSIKSKADSSSIIADTLQSKANVSLPAASKANIEFKPEPTPKNDFEKKRFWLVSVESGSMSQKASVAQNEEANYKYLRFQLSNGNVGTPIFTSLRINHLWQVHSTLALGFRISYSLIHQKINADLEPAKFAPSIYTFGKDSNSITAVAVNQDPQTIFSRNSHMIDPGFFAQYKPNWSPIGIQLAAQWIGFNVTADKNLISGSVYQNLQIHTGLFFPFGKRFQILANAFFLKSDDYFLPIPVISKGNGWVGTLGIGMKW